MALVGIHLVVYVAVNALLVAVWLLTTGSLDQMTDIASDPVSADRKGFWPVWVILGWGTALAIHVGSHVWLRAVRALRWAGQEAGPLVRRAATRREAGHRWTVVMFTDIVNSTGLNEHIGDAAWSRRLTDHRAMVREAIGRCGGVEVGTQGDGFLARFDHPAPAVACALDIHDRLAADPGDPAIELRIGVHAGEAVHDDGDLVGRVVNLASRVTAVAAPGEVLVTEAVADHAVAGVGKGGADLEFVDRGVHELKGIQGPRHLLAARRVGAPEVGSG